MSAKSYLSGKVVVHGGDCLDVLKGLPDSSVDSCVTDPPYALVSIAKRFATVSELDVAVAQKTPHRRTSGGFMGKQWDTGDRAFSVEFWREVWRVLKPGGHVLAFGGTRTYHRLVCAIEDAGFDIRDQIMWVFAQGFPKALNLKNGSICNCAESGNALPSTHGNALSEYDMRPVRNSDLPEAEHTSEERREILLNGVSEQGISAYRIASAESCNDGREQSRLAGRQLHRAREGLSNGADARSPKSAREWIRSGAHSSGRTDARATTQVGRGSASREQGSSRQPSRKSAGVREPSGALDGRTLPGCGACPRCGKLKKEFEGFSTALKPAVEPIVLARKPLSEPTVAANCLKHGTGAINIDGCRVGTGGDRTSGGAQGSMPQPMDWGTDTGRERPTGARWPANLIHDGSDEVVAAFPERAPTWGRATRGGTRNSGYGMNGGAEDIGYGDSGSAARFFYSARPDHRCALCDALVAEASSPTGNIQTESSVPLDAPGQNEAKPKESVARFWYSSKADADDRLGSSHPTVKPLDLIQYLVRLITSPNGICLDPFAGTGTTGEAAFREGMRAILIEREPEYLADIERRMELVLSGPVERRQSSIKARGKTEHAGPLFALPEAAE